VIGVESLSGCRRANTKSGSFASNAFLRGNPPTRRPVESVGWSDAYKESDISTTKPNNLALMLGCLPALLASK
jgi:hypothetical protein